MAKKPKKLARVFILLFMVDELFSKANRLCTTPKCKPANEIALEPKAVYSLRAGKGRRSLALQRGPEAGPETK